MKEKLFKNKTKATNISESSESLENLLDSPTQTENQDVNADQQSTEFAPVIAVKKRKKKRGMQLMNGILRKRSGTQKSSMSSHSK